MENIKLINEELKRFKEIYNYISNETEKIKKTYLIESTPPPVATLEKRIETFLKDNFAAIKAADNTAATRIENYIETAIRNNDSSFNMNNPIEKKVEKLFDLYKNKVELINDRTSQGAQEIIKAATNLFKLVSEKGGDDSFARAIFDKHKDSIEDTINNALKQKATTLGKELKNLTDVEVKSVIDNYATTIETVLGAKFKTVYLEKFKDYKGHLGTNIDRAMDDLTSMFNSRSLDKQKSSTYLIGFGIKFFTRYWYYSTKKLSTLLGEMEFLLKEMEIKRGKGEVYEDEIHQYILKFMEATRITEKDEKAVFEDYVYKNTNINSKIKDRIKTFMDDSTIMKAIQEAMKLDKNKKVWYSFKGRLIRSLESLPIGNLIAKMTQDFKDTFKDWNFLKYLLPDPKALANTIMWKDARSIDEVATMMYTAGAKNTVIAKILNFIVFQNFVVPSFLGFFQYIKYRLYRKKEILKYNGLVTWCNATKKLGAKQPEFCNDLKPIEDSLPSEKEFTEFLLSSLPIDVTGKNPYQDLGSMGPALKLFGCWTWLDEIIVEVIRLIRLSIDWTEIPGEFGDTIQSKLEEVLAKKRQILIDNGIDPDATFIDQLKLLKEKFKNEINTTIDDKVNKVINYYDEGKSKGKEAAFNMWGLTQNPKLSFKEFGKMSDGTPDGSIVASDGNNYVIKEDGLGYEKF